MSEGTKIGNPAAVGLAGFGGATLLLQFANLGWCGDGIVVCCAIFFGGLAQLIAGLQEFRTGNNFGYAVFATYGAFWMALAGILICLLNGWLGITAKDVGYFMVVFSVLTFMYFIGSLMISRAHAFTFFTLLLGFIFLDIFFLGSGSSAFKKVGAVVLIVCACSAWYMMMHVVLADLGVKLPLGKPLVKAAPEPKTKAIEAA
ncbi:MAG: acetate uptake transporter [Dehalococcoidia bacterium]|nr:acetate uptake transporter [Dehalococcoidia bacterium]